jgi:hypothetical protein
MGFFPPFTALFPAFAENAAAVQQTTAPARKIRSACAANPLFF